jgi:hypothetical protein
MVNAPSESWHYRPWVNSAFYPAGYVISHNVTRRNLNASQRAMVAASFMEYETMQAKKTQGPLTAVTNGRR